MIFVLEFQGHFWQSQQKYDSFEQVFVWWFYNNDVDDDGLEVS